MADPLFLRRQGYRALFALVICSVVFVRILPFHVEADSFPAPDLITLLTFAWVLRRPEYLPVLLVAAAGLFSDILFMQPPGLSALLLVLGAEFLRGRGHLSAELPFLVEWTMVSAVLVVMAIAEIVVHGIFLLPQPPLTSLALQLAVSIVCYPLVVLATAYGFGVRSPTLIEGELNRP